MNCNIVLLLSFMGKHMSVNILCFKTLSRNLFLILCLKITCLFSVKPDLACSTFRHMGAQKKPLAQINNSPSWRVGGKPIDSTQVKLNSPTYHLAFKLDRGAVTERIIVGPAGAF